MTDFATLSSGSFLDGIGVDTEITYTDGAYATVANVIADLKYLGVTTVRDGLSDGAGGSAPLASYIEVAQAGIKLTVLMSTSNTDNADILTELGWIEQIVAAAPGSVIGIEGPNEVNNFPVTFDGTSGLAGALAYQAALYADVKADSLLSSIAVDYFTGYDAGTVALGPDVPTAGLADADNQHPYVGIASGDTLSGAPLAYVTRSTALPNETSSTAAAVYTETGYSTNEVNAYTQAVYELDLLLDTAAQGIGETYLYQLLDAYAPGSTQGDNGFGMFDYTGAPKLVAQALHDLTAIVSAQEGAGTVASFTIGDLPTNANALELTGSHDIIALWAEPEIWDAAADTNVSAAVEDVTVTLAHSYATIALFDPLSGTSAIELFTNTSVVTVGLTDHPLLLELDAAPCFLAGTRIRTPGGERPVESLREGDMVDTAMGPRPLTWTGRLDFRPEQIAGRHLFWPVCLRAGAIAPGVPSRDLWVSPGHAIRLGQALVPAWRLVNGVSVVQPEATSPVTYVHLALPRHGILFAENCPTESYLDDECGLHFASRPPRLAEPPCLPRLDSGFALRAIQRRLARRAGLFGASARAGALRGFLDQSGPVRLAGWAQDADAPEDPVELEVREDGAFLTRVLANLYRADLRAAGLGGGCHGFEVALPRPVQGRLQVHSLRHGAALPGWDTARPG